VFTERACKSLPVKTKTGREVSDVFERIPPVLNDRACNMLPDKGSEFVNSTFQSMLRRPEVKFYTSENKDIKGCNCREI